MWAFVGRRLCWVLDRGICGRGVARALGGGSYPGPVYLTSSELWGGHDGWTGVSREDAEAAPLDPTPLVARSPSDGGGVAPLPRRQRSLIAGAEADLPARGLLGTMAC